MNAGSFVVRRLVVLERTAVDLPERSSGLKRRLISMRSGGIRCRPHTDTSSIPIVLEAEVRDDEIRPATEVHSYRTISCGIGVLSDVDLEFRYFDVGETRTRVVTNSHANRSEERRVGKDCSSQ